MDYTRIPLAEVRPGMVLARPVPEPGGKAVLPAGVVLTDSLIRRLHQWQAASLMVAVGRGPRGHRQPLLEEPRSDPRVPAVLRHETFTDATETLRSLVADLSAGSSAGLDAAHAVIDRLLGEIMQRLDVVSALVSLKDADDYSYRHGVGTCLVAMTAAARMQVAGEDLRDIGLAALLADTGMVRVPEAIRNKTRRLTAAEWAEVRRHPAYSAELARRVQGVSQPVAEAVLQHHERWDGSGYPRGLAGAAISPHARLIALADAYDAITSGRPYALARPPFLAAEDLLAQSGRLFDPDLTGRFVANLLNYRSGALVELNDGQLAMVSARHPEAPTRPVVTPCDEARRPVGDPLDLRQRTDLHVLRLAGDPQL